MSGDHPTRRSRVALVAGAVGAGSLLVASLPPWHVWLAGPVGLGLFVATLADRPWRERMIVGGTVGAVWLGITLRWAAAFSGPGVVLLVLLQTAFPA